MKVFNNIAYILIVPLELDTAKEARVGIRSGLGFRV
jgi:hypothetical protein